MVVSGFINTYPNQPVPAYLQSLSGYATNQASESQSVNTSAFHGTNVSSSRSGSIGVEKSLELYKRSVLKIAHERWPGASGSRAQVQHAVGTALL